MKKILYGGILSLISSLVVVYAMEKIKPEEEAHWLIELAERIQKKSISTQSNNEEQENDKAFEQRLQTINPYARLIHAFTELEDIKDYKQITLDPSGTKIAALVEKMNGQAILSYDLVVYDIKEKKLKTIALDKKEIGQIALAAHDDLIALSEKNTIWLFDINKKENIQLGTLDNQTDLIDTLAFNKQGDKVGALIHNDPEFDENLDTWFSIKMYPVKKE